MASALIGYSGFVGSTLMTQTAFDQLYRSTNIAQIAGRSFDVLVCAGAPAAKWKANRAPDEDLANLELLMGQLASTKAETAILISTVDVFGRPEAAYEDTPIDFAETTAYGKHRRQLEEFFTAHFPHAFVLRLPGLFGHGLRKNFVFDLLRNPDSLTLTHCESVFQFYDMSRLWADVKLAVDAGISLLHLATGPVSARDVAAECFGVEFNNITASAPVRYDLRTRHAAVMGGSDDYLASREEVLQQIAAFARMERAAIA